MNINSWKVEQRSQLISARQTLDHERQKFIQNEVLSIVSALLKQQQPGIIGIYWPIKGEIDCRPLAASLLDEGWQLAVPVIDEANKRLVFCDWHPETEMMTGVWNIPVPQQKTELQPDTYLIPLVGFDKDFYRLGYGAGYYDRTLADIADEVIKVGVGIEQGRLATIHPHQFDIQMDYIVTENGLYQR